MIYFNERKRNKVDDNEIIKAWEKVCATGDAPVGEHWGCSVTTKLAKDTLETLKRKKAEIERLKEQVNLWQEEAGSVGCANEWLKASLKNAKAEAIKEFWSRLQGIAYRSEVVWSHGEHPMLIELDDAEEIYEEMVGDAE